MTRSLSFFAVLLALFLEPASVQAGKMIRFASPLQSLTIPDREQVQELSTKRQRFLPRFKAGLQAEVEARRDLAAKRTSELQDAAVSGSSDWAQRTTVAERSRRAKEDEIVEQAYDMAVAQFDKNHKPKDAGSKSASKNAYQFVGVISRRKGSSSGKPITWYARPKPAGAKWSVRLLHVNQDAIIKDLFNRGKIDIFAKYKNTGKVDEETKTPIVTSTYEVRERSWKNAWNFSPKHFFTDPSGMYWRERRLQPGLYTDGLSVYESSYRYGDGRNGMHRVSGFSQFLTSKAISKEQKDRILQRLQKDAPDVVLEL